MLLSIAETIIVRSLLICDVRTYCSVCGRVCVCVFFNSRTYAQGHTPTVIREEVEGGGGC